jgi:3',5'-cyclic AMP phosphodiesterase CpdA
MAAGAALGGFGGLCQIAIAANDESKTAARKRSLRIAHLTDVHVQPELGAGEGLIACLHHVQSQADKADIIFNGGDAVMDTLAVGADRTKLLWKLYLDTMRQESSLPIEHCLGNHDVWGWDKKKSGMSGSEPGYGKAWAMDVLGLAKPYHSFDRAGWHFIVLDSIHESTDALFEGRLDDEQFDWFVGDLRNCPAATPICIMSHMPILSAATFFDGQNEKSGKEWRVSGAQVHLDARKLKDLFFQHPNVKLCLSGHLHLLDRVDYNGVSYLCNGAVCGNWWKGKRQETDAGYALVDLYDDGSFERQYIEYGWKARPA